MENIGSIPEAVGKTALLPSAENTSANFARIDSGDNRDYSIEDLPKKRIKQIVTNEEEESKELLHSNDTTRKSDKQNNDPKLERLTENLNIADSIFCGLTMFANVGAGFLHLTGLSDKTKKRIESLSKLVTRSGFIPYGGSGVLQGIAKNNIFQALGFVGEIIFAWFSETKDLYLSRGLPTGIDQIWVATDKNLPNGGKFKSWSEGITQTLSISWKMLKEFFSDPIKKLFPFERVDGKLTANSKGHNALMSTILDCISTIGYKLTGNEKIFGACRDAGAVLFDLEMLFHPEKKGKISGLLFVLESCTDFISRYFKGGARMFLNHISIASGRLALMLYRTLDSAASQNNKGDASEKSFAKPPVETLNLPREETRDNSRLLAI